MIDDAKRPYPLDDNPDERALELVWTGQWMTKSVLASTLSKPEGRRPAMFMTGRRLEQVISQAYDEGYQRGHLNGMNFIRCQIERGELPPSIPTGYKLVRKAEGNERMSGAKDRYRFGALRRDQACRVLVQGAWLTIAEPYEDVRRRFWDAGRRNLDVIYVGANPDATVLVLEPNGRTSYEAQVVAGFGAGYALAPVDDRDAKWFGLRSPAPAIQEQG